MSVPNGILLVDKPKGFTSFDVIGKLRGILKTKKMGHAGTLDPMATGVLPVFIGRATRAIPFLEDHDKIYNAVMQLGIVTDTQDITGTILKTVDVKEMQPKNGDIADVISSFVGDITQIPPMYSAVKVDGKRLYDLARKGIEVERQPRQIHINFIDILASDPEKNSYTLNVGCSKGTYIRTLCHDIGAKIGTGAVLTELRRVDACGYDESECLTFDEISDFVEKGDWSIIKPIDTAFSYLPRLNLSEDHAKKIANGIKPTFSDLRYTALDTDKDIMYSVYSESGLFIGLCFGDRQKESLIPKRIFSERM